MGEISEMMLDDCPTVRRGRGRGRPAVLEIGPRPLWWRVAQLIRRFFA